MIELKVHCDCGQKYKFDVEPVNGQMPFTVACPICKRDGTARANAMLQTMSLFKPADAAPAAPPPFVPAQTAPTPAPIAPPPQVAPGKLRINMVTHSGPAAAAPPPIAGGGAPPTIAPAGVALPPTSGRPRFGPGAAAVGQPEQKGNFALGLLGAFVGAAVGATLYFFIYHFTGPIPFLRYFLALGVGGLTGWLANFLGKGEGSKELGALAAVFTIIAILGAQYLVQSGRLHSHDDFRDSLNQSIEDGGYTMAVKEAKDVVKAIPNGSDPEIRMYIAKQQTEDGEAPKLETISNDQVKEFRTAEWTNYMDLASGSQTKEQYWAKTGFDPKAAKKIRDAEDTAMTGIAVVLTVLRAGIISMIVGAGLAYKLSANA